jgi:hypothetical protein
VEPCISRCAARETHGLVAYRSPYIDECPRQLDIIAQRLIAHFLPLFLDPNGPELTLSDAFQQIDLRAFFRENFQAFSTERKFQVGGEEFTLSGFRLKGALADHHKIVYAAHFREVITERIAKFLPNLKSRLAERDQSGFYYLAFVQGRYLNEKVNSERTDFSIPKDGPERAASIPASDARTSELFTDEITLSSVREGASCGFGAFCRSALGSPLKIRL